MQEKHTGKMKELHFVTRELPSTLSKLVKNHIRDKIVKESHKEDKVGLYKIFAEHLPLEKNIQVLSALEFSHLNFQRA